VDKHTGDEIPPTPWRTASGEELHFHYNREEREATRQRVWTPPTGGFLRRNRALAIVLVDVIIVVLLFFIYLFFIRPMEGQVRLGAYRASAQTFLMEDDLLVVVTVSHQPRFLRDDSQPAAQPLVTVRVNEASTVDLAPLPDRERTIILRVSRENAPETGMLTVTVQVDSEEGEVSVPVHSD
jgi:biopolymer transport protein ExbD